MGREWQRLGNKESREMTEVPWEKDQVVSLT